MENPTIKNKGVALLFLLLSLQLFAQNFVPFAPRFNQDLKGDIQLIGNNILGPNNNAFNNLSTYNHNVNMVYIDIDGDASTFSSSSADLSIPNPGCYRIIHAGLYWGAVTPDAAEPITNIKFKGPSGGYNDVVGTVIFDAGGTSVDAGDSFPYACFADVTSIVTALATNLGTYTIANVSSAQGRTRNFGNNTGHSAGWSLYIVYEDPTLPGKSITSFDGFSAISVPGGNPDLEIPVSGFRTIPAPSPVRANFAFATLEGDSPILGDQLLLNGLNLSTTDRSASNFFNSSVTQLSALPVNNRNPNSANTLGFDTGVMVVPNPSNSVITNGATSATVRLETTGDTYFPYFFSLAVDIIEPNIVLTKVVEDVLGNNIEGMLVNLGDELNYVLGFQNTGNDDTTDYVIRDILPINIVFDYPSDIGILPAGITHSYNAATRELVFNIDNDLVQENDPVQEIRFKVTVVSECSLLTDACSNIINNQAFSTYKGTQNPLFIISDDPEPSFSNNTGCLLSPGSTNFLADIDCVFEEEVILCGASTVLTSGNGYDSYSWSTSPSGTPVIGTTQSITVTTTGTYYVSNTAIAPCQSTEQVFEVITFGAGVTNPVIPFADEVSICPNDGKELPNIFLCGGNGPRLIDTNITDTTSIIWEQLDETSCAAVTNLDCANEDSACNWNQVGTGPSFMADTAGQFRLTLNYDGGCFNQFYFNVYTNLLVPTVTSRDIYCTTPGEIVIGSIPSGYEFSIDDITYQTSNVFPVNTPGIYSVYIKQIGVDPNPCIFTVPDVQIRQTDFTVSTIVTQPICNGDFGSIAIAANDVRPQYYFSISEGGTIVNSVGPITPNDYTFSNLNPGTYTIDVSTDDGCVYSEDIDIVEPALLEATSALTTPLTCTDGVITIYPVGGTPPYFYFVNGATDFQTIPTIAVTVPGVFNIRVVDSNNCEAATSITVDAIPAPDFTVNKTDILCFGDNNGEININVTNANGNTLRYSIDNGVTYFSSPNFTGLSVADYDVVVEYTAGTDVCITAPEIISIIENSAIDATATLTTPYTCLSDGVITVSGVTGGTAPYMYSINGVTFQSGLTFSGLTNGSYTITVRDSNNCTFTTAPIVIDPLDPPTDLDFTNTALSCPLNTSNVTLTATGGEGALEYQITAPSGSVTAYQASNEFVGLDPGTYTFQVNDAKGCVYSESYTIEPLPVISVVGQTINDITCFGASDGAVRFTVSETTNFTYTINAGASISGTSPINETGLSVGTYTIIITDIDTNCTATASATVSGPPTALSITSTASPLTCVTNGSVVVNVSGGTGSYTYQLTQPDASILPIQNSNTFSNLTQVGTYTVSVTDSSNCEITDTFSISLPETPSGSINVSSDYCIDGTNGATLIVDAQDGIAPYEYSINGSPFDTSNTFDNLIAGTYTITIRDAFGCEIDLLAETIEAQLSVNTVLDKGLDCTIISPDAEITGTITGGYAPYSYEVSINSASYIPLGATGTPFSYTAGTDGTYQFQITDDQGCTAESGIITVEAITNPTATETVVNPSCNGDTNGSVQIIPSGGEGPYTYSFNGSAFTTTFLYTSLSAGTYNYEVLDSKSCPFTGSVTLTEPGALGANASVIPFSCSVTNTVESATITINLPTGGSSPYTYSFNGAGFSSTNSFTINDTGADQTITWSVRDSQDCTINGSETITTLDSPTDLDFSATTVTCLATTSDVTLTTTNGAAPLTYTIIAPASATSNTTGVSNGVFTGLTPDTYNFRVTDANGCFYEESYNIEPVTPISVTGLKLSDVLCIGDNTGAIEFTISGNSGAYTYAIISGSGTETQSGNTVDLTNLVADTYTIEVTDSVTGCTDTSTVTISEPTDAVTFTTSSTNVFCTNDESQITVTASGGTPNYTYAAVLSTTTAPALVDYNSSSIITVDTNAAVNLVWDVYVRDANGCITMNTVTIVGDGLPTVTIPTIATNQCTATSGFTFTATGTGIAPLSYSINGGASYQTSAIFTINTPGVYTVTIRDGNGCTATSSNSTEIFAPLTAGAILTKDLTCTLPVEASIDINVLGGNGPYIYEVTSDGGTSYSSITGSPYTTPTPGTYSFRITDANSCTVETNDVIVNPAIIPDITAVTQTQDILCNGEATAAIEVTIDNSLGLAPFIINVNNDTTSTDYGTQTSGLEAGSYTITVTDANGCTDTFPIVINEPLVIASTATALPIMCSAAGVSQGSVIVDGASGGTAPYNYYVTGTNGYSNSELNTSGTASVNFDVVDFGLYEVLVVDANGCSILIQDILVASPVDHLDIVVTSPPADCSTGGSATVSVGSSLSGAGPFHFAIYTTPGMTYTSPTTAPWQDEDAVGSKETTFTDLIPGVTYTFIIYDEVTMCYYYETSTLPVPTNSTLTIDSTVANNVTCTSSADGNVNFNINSTYSTITPVTYEIFESATIVTTSISGSGNVPANGTLPVPNLGPLPPGNYFVLITEDVGATNAGCSVVTLPFNITESRNLLLINADVTRNENCNELGIITARAQDGTAPYEYQTVLVATAGTGVPVSTDWGIANTFNLPAGIYDVFVRDAYGCVQLDSETIIRDADPTINTLVLQCYEGTPFNITLSGTVSSGTPTYSIGGAFQTSPDFVISTPGTYTLTIQDENGCTATTTYIVQPQLLLDANLTQDLLCGTDASITLTAAGGTGTYTLYEVSNDGGSTYNPTSSGGVTHVTNVDGTYQFRVTDDQGCEAESGTIIVTPITTPTLTETHVDVTCNGDSDGSIVVTASNGIPPYQYSIDNGATFQSSNTFSNLVPSVSAVTPYNIVVIDSKNCISAATLVIITEPIIVTGSSALTQSLSCGVGNSTQSAIVTVTANGGTAPYTYSFDGGSNYTSTNTYTTNISGTVTAFVKDANGCTSVAIIETIPALDPPTDLDFVSSDITCSVTMSDVTLTPTDGVGPFTYQILSPASATGNTTGATTGIFTGLTPDTYLFEVTDDNGCIYEESYPITPVTNIAVSGLLVNDVTCFNASNGAVTFTVSNFTTTYSYTINGVPTGTAQTATTIPLIGLANGDQVIVVTDETTDCSATATVTVNQPVDLILTELSNVVANCNFGAQVAVDAAGGTAPYYYAFVQDGATPVAADYSTSNAIVLDPTVNTVWDVYVEDANGCVDDIEITIATAPLPTLSLPVLASNQCNLTGDPYTFTVASSTGVAPLEYSIGNGFQASDTFTVSAAGTYSVTVKDANGCTASSTSITIYDALGITPTITALPSCLDNDGEVTLNVTGGSGNYTYEITSGPSLRPSQASNVFTGLGSGNYTVTVTDTTTLCTSDISVELSLATPVTFTTIPTNVTCNGDSDGTITVNLPATNDNPIYTYEITAPIVVAPQTSNVFLDLPQGTYTIRVNSGRNCFAIDTETVGEPLLLEASGTVTPYTCDANNIVNTSTLDISETGGTAPYKYSIDGVNYLDTNIFDIIDTGIIQTIDIYVKDDNGCIATNTVSIDPLVIISATSVIEATPIDCNGTGSVSISVTGGSGDFTFQILPSGVAQVSNTFNITEPGDYYFQVNDVITGCYTNTAAFSVIPFDNGDVELTATSNVTCFGDTDGILEINITGYTGAYTYEVFDDLGTSVNGVVSANTSTNPEVVTGGITGGNYNVVITETDSPFCNVISNFVTVLSPSEALDLIALETSNVTCDDDKGTITATATGGWGTYEYELTGTTTVAYSSNGTFTNLSAGLYTVNVRDAGGCIVSENVPLNLPTTIDAAINATPSLLSCFGDKNATITVSAVTGGAGTSYSYTLNMVSPTVSASGPQTSPIFDDLGEGTYNVVVTDGYNCEFTTANVTITEPTEVEVSLVESTSETCTTQTRLTLSATGGTGTYEYSDTASFATSLGTFTTSVTFDVTSGTYAYYVRDASSCSANVSNSITIDPLSILTVSLDTTNAVINCAGDDSGVIIASAEGGLGSYIYTLQDTSGTPITTVTQLSPGVFTNLLVGNYQVQVDSGDCLEVSAVAPITNAASPLDVMFNPIDITCNGENDGMLEITTSGGSGTIKYAISPQLDQFFDVETVENLAPGNYDIVVQDELGCYTTYNFDIDQPLPLGFNYTILSEAPCDGDSTGSFTIEIFGGEPPYSVSLDDITYTPLPLGTTTYTFSGLEGGEKMVYVLDSENCGGDSPFSIPLVEPVILDPVADIDYECINDFTNNTNSVTNRVTVTVDSSITDTSVLEYALDGGTFATGIGIYENLSPGSHSIEVRHPNECVKITDNGIPFIIETFQPLNLVLNDGGLNEIVAEASGGSEPYEYKLNDGAYGDDNTFLIFASGDYTVTVMDANGCEVSATRFFEFIDVCIPNYFTPNSEGWGPGCSSQYKDLTVDIFDRYGRKIATLKVGDKWDGKYKGNELPTGDYWYVVKLNEPQYNREFVGHFTLYR